jgi:predicted peptidase
VFARPGLATCAFRLPEKLVWRPSPWVFHGAKDNTVPSRRSEEMVEAIKAAGGNVKFTVYPEAGHDSWTQAYNDPELYQWLREQKRHAK